MVGGVAVADSLRAQRADQHARQLPAVEVQDTRTGQGAVRDENVLLRGGFDAGADESGRRK